MLPGLASLVNVSTVLLGATIGVLLGNRLPVRTRDLVTDALGLVTLLIAATSAMEVLSPDLSDEVGDTAPMLIVAGDEDDAVLEPSLMMKRTIPTSDLFIMPGSGHMTNLEDPALFNRVVEDFFRDAEMRGEKG